MERLSGDQHRVLHALGEAIAAAPLNLVGRRDRGLLHDVHIPECVAVGRHLSPTDGARWMDLGTGGGLPGLVLAVLFPAVRWTLLDATEKKVAAVRGFAAALGISIEAQAGRAEQLAHDPALRGQFEGVVARAVAPMPTLLELAAGFLAPGGMLHAVKGPSWEAEVTRAAGAAEVLGLALKGVTQVSDAVRPSWVVCYRSHGTPHTGYPRRDGLPKSEPLGG